MSEAEIGTFRLRVLGGYEEASARHGLRDALHILRRTLGAGAVPTAGRLLRLDPAVVAGAKRVDGGHGRSSTTR